MSDNNTTTTLQQEFAHSARLMKRIRQYCRTHPDIDAFASVDDVGEDYVVVWWEHYECSFCDPEKVFYSIHLEDLTEEGLAEASRLAEVRRLEKGLDALEQLHAKLLADADARHAENSEENS